jgi:hypothetical protein
MSNFDLGEDCGMDVGGGGHEVEGIDVIFIERQYLYRVRSLNCLPSSTQSIQPVLISPDHQKPEWGLGGTNV